MEVGVPKRAKDQEFRVGLSPSSVQTLQNGHQVFVEMSAGVGAGFTDQDYLQTGAKIVPQPQDGRNQT